MQALMTAIWLCACSRVIPSLILGLFTVLPGMATRGGVWQWFQGSICCATCLYFRMSKHSTASYIVETVSSKHMPHRIHCLTSSRSVKLVQVPYEQCTLAMESYPYPRRPGYNTRN